MLCTGDVIIVREPQFANCGTCFFQNVLCWEANHAAIAISPKDFSRDSNLRTRHPEIEDSKTYLLHALVTGIKVWEFGQYCNRVYGGCAPGAIFARQLEFEVDEPEFRKQMAKEVDELFCDVADKPYEQHCCTMISAYYDGCERFGCCKSAPDDSSIFCSELVAMTLQKARVLSDDRPADEFTPMDFLSSDGEYVEEAPFLPGMTFGPTLQVLPLIE